MVSSRTNFLSEKIFSLKLMFDSYYPKKCIQKKNHIVLNQYTYFIHPIEISSPNINVC